MRLCPATPAGTQRTKNRPLVRVVAGPAAYVFEFDTESDREELINAIQELTVRALGVCFTVRECLELQISLSALVAFLLTDRPRLKNKLPWLPRACATAAPGRQRVRDRRR